MNGFVRRQLAIGSVQPLHKLKECAQCNEMKPPEGGIQMSHTKWHCVSCWTNRVTRRNLRNAKTQTTGTLDR
jgi:hypothetical protein